MSKEKRHIEKYELIKKFERRNLDPMVIYFRPGMNVIVGENGCGKSTLIKLITDPEFVKENKVLQKITLSKDAKANDVQFMMFDTETQNPRIKGKLEEETAEYQVLSRFMSHGQTLLPILEHVSNEKNKIIIVDEPESGLSLKSQRRILKAFRKAVGNGCQIILATHSYVIISDVKRVYDMERRVWVNSDSYLTEQTGIDNSAESKISEKI